MQYREMLSRSVYKILLICLYLNVILVLFLFANDGKLIKWNTPINICFELPLHYLKSPDYICTKYYEFVVNDQVMFKRISSRFVVATVNNVGTNNRSRLLRQQEPIDVVYTWVNDSDPKFIEDLLFWREKQWDFYNSSNSKSKRFTNWNTLLFSLRSIEKYADWIRHVYVVTNGQIPQWLNLSCPRVTIVTHMEIFTNKSHLPTFSSCAIEAHIHRIPGLSKRFLYLNDDVFFGQPVTLEDFYSKQNGTTLRLGHTNVGNCITDCAITKINNRHCDEECNIEQCEWDGRDCGIEKISENVAVALGKRFGLYHGHVFHTAVVLNSAFGSVNRFVPAHVPHFIDRDWMTELQNRFPKEYDQTSSHRFRSTIVMQYAFAYYNYIIATSHNESRRDEFRYTLKTNQSMFIIVNTPNSLKKKLERNLSDHVRRKFVCLNDNAKFDNDEEKEYIRIILTDYLKKIFPKPSAFEKRENR